MAKHWVIPDIHGNRKTLQALIEDQIKPTRYDTLYFLGDYIDRGNDSKGVIDYIIRLQEDDYTVRTLRGNHEDYLIRTFDNETVRKNLLGISFRNQLKKEWYKYGGKETLKSFGVTDVHEIPEKYIEWMRGLEFFIELNSYILVHAGLNFGIDNPFDDRHSMLWIKEFTVDMEKTGNRKIIHGHVPVSLDFIGVLRTSSTFKFIDLDNGVYMTGKEGFGNLVALELDSLEWKIQPNADIL
ncbi:MAG: serine/threonine protein phosphatase [Bacteroidales bacterium]|nr:serine/threonine protein phosphatase [Bacteroidales bacterium]